MMLLKSLQSEFQNYLLDRPADILGHVRGNSRLDAKGMMNVYHYGYKARLVGCLATDFPTLAAFMGQEEFTKMAHLYIAAYPSQTSSVRWLGQHLTTFLQKVSPYKESVILRDLALFEWVIAYAFDAKDAPMMGMADMAIVPPESWASLKLIFHPSVSSVTLTTKAPILREAIQADQDVTAIDRRAGADRQWWIWRQDLEVKYHQASEDEAMSFKLMQEGGEFAAMCDQLIPTIGEENASFRAAEILRAWLDWGMVSEIEYDSLSSPA